MAIEEIRQFKCRDGTILSTMQGAQRHELKLDLYDFVESKCYEGMGKSDIADFIWEHQDQIRLFIL